MQAMGWREEGTGPSAPSTHADTVPQEEVQVGVRKTGCGNGWARPLGHLLPAGRLSVIFIAF